MVPYPGLDGANPVSLLSPHQNNGGCSPYAVCKGAGDGQRTCTCDAAHTVGDGFTCRARVGLVMVPKLDPRHSLGCDLLGPDPRF